MIDRMKYQYFDFSAISLLEEKAKKTGKKKTTTRSKENGNFSPSVEREKVFVDGKFYNHALYQLFRNFPLVYLLLYEAENLVLTV